MFFLSQNSALIPSKTSQRRQIKCHLLVISLSSVSEDLSIQDCARLDQHQSAPSAEISSKGEQSKRRRIVEIERQRKKLCSLKAPAQGLSHLRETAGSVVSSTMGALKLQNVARLQQVFLVAAVQFLR